MLQSGRIFECQHAVREREFALDAQQEFTFLG